MIVPLPVEFHERKLRQLWEYFADIPAQHFGAEFRAHALMVKEQKQRHTWLALDGDGMDGNR